MSVSHKSRCVAAVDHIYFLPKIIKFVKFLIFTFFADSQATSATLKYPQHILNNNKHPSTHF